MYNPIISTLHHVNNMYTNFRFIFPLPYYSQYSLFNCSCCMQSDIKSKHLSRESWPKKLSFTLLYHTVDFNPIIVLQVCAWA